MIVCSASNNVEPLGDQGLRKRRCVGNNPFLGSPIVVPHTFPEKYGFGSDGTEIRGALNSRKDRAVDAFALLVGGLIAGQDDATLRATGLVSARSDKVRMRYGRWVNSRRHEPEYVSDIRKQNASAFLRNHSHAR